MSVQTQFVGVTGQTAVCEFREVVYFVAKFELNDTGDDISAGS